MQIPFDAYCPLVDGEATPKRAVKAVGFGYACYKRVDDDRLTDDGKVYYLHVGLVEDEKQATDFLLGKDITPKAKYPLFSIESNPCTRD